MNIIKIIAFFLLASLASAQTVPIRNPQIQGASGSIISGATLTNNGTLVNAGTLTNSGTINGAGTFNFGSGTVTLPASSVTSGNIADGAIVNADINASAAIDITKLASSAITIAGTSTSLGGSITASTILDSISSTQGTILYRGASGWSALSPGTSGHFLKTQGAGANPMWDAAAGSGSVATDAVWDAAGDLAVGTGANTAARLAIGANGYVLTSNGTTAAWAAAASGISGLTSTRVPFATGATTLEDDADLTFATDTLSGTALKINVTATTAATSSTTGALIVAGGIGANKDSWINGLRVGRGGGDVNSNTALGEGAMAATATGINNVAIGENVLAALLGGNRNMMIGHESGNGVTSGSENAGAGNQALYTVSTGNYNSGFGAATLSGVTTASSNTALGYQAGTYRNAGLSTLLVNPSNSIYIGDNAIGNADSETNAIVIGSAAIGEGSNKTVIGNSSTTNTRIYGALSIGQATGTATAGKITLNGSTSGSISLLSPAAPTTYTLTLPSADASGVLASNGSGAMSIVGTTAGGNGTADSGKVPLLTVDGGLNLGKLDVATGTAVIAARCDTGVGIQSVVNTLGYCFWAYPLGSSSSGYHCHVQGGTTGAIIGFDGDMTGGTGVNYLVSGVVRTDGLFFYGYEYETGVQRDRFAITATGDIHRYKNGTTFSTGTDKTILTFSTPSGTNTITFPAATGTVVATASGAVALTTDTTGNYVADVAGTSNEITSTHTPGEGSTATLSLPATIDLGGKTSFEIPNGAAPTVDAFGEIAGDNDLWAASRGAPVFFDGTASTALVNVLVSDAPSNGQVPKWNTGGTITWEADNSGGTISGTDTQVMFFDGTDTPAGDAGMTYNKTTNVLTATGFVGALTGNASTVTTNANLTGDVTSSGNATTLAAASAPGPLLAENASIRLDPAGSADGKYSGTTVTGTAGATLAFGDVVVLDVTDSRWELADANSAAAADGDSRAMLGICVLAAASDGSATTILLHGIVRADTAFPTLTVGAPVYVSETAGDATSTQPTTADVLIRVIGHALTADEMFFNPDNSWITHL